MNKFIILSAVLLTACAQTADKIEAIPMSNVYDNTSCSKARSLLITEQENLIKLSNEQAKAATNDAIGVLLIGIPTASMNGKDKVGEIGTSKGKIDALNKRLSRC